jgi:hypothetical protein
MKKRGRKPNRGKLTSRASKVVADLKKSIPLTRLAQRYGVSKQALNQFIKARKIKRPFIPKPNHVTTCRLCRHITEAASKPRSEFLALPTVMKQVGLVFSKTKDRREFRDHLRRLKHAKIVSPLFGRIIGKHYETAFQDYFTLRIPVTHIGRKHGIANLLSVIERYKEKGFKFPSPLFKYNGDARRTRPRERINTGKRAKVK